MALFITTSSAGQAGPWVFCFLASLAAEEAGMLLGHTDGSTEVSQPHPTPQGPQRQGWGRSTNDCRGDARRRLGPRLNLFKDVEMAGGLPFRLTSPPPLIFISSRGCEPHSLNLNPLWGHIYTPLPFVIYHCHIPLCPHPQPPAQDRATIISPTPTDPTEDRPALPGTQVGSKIKTGQNL